MKNSFLFSIVLLLSICFIIFSCQKSTQVPDDFSLAEAFNKDLTTYGWNEMRDYVNYKVPQKMSEYGRDAYLGWKQLRDSVYVWRLGKAEIVIREIKIFPNESDRFPYGGTIKSSIKYAGRSREEYFQTDYYFGNKTNKWIRKEAITP